MNFPKWFILCSLLFFAACAGGTADDNANGPQLPALTPSQDRAFLQLVGTLGERKDVNMELQKNQSSYWGTCYYAGLPEPIFVDGELDSLGTLTIWERTETERHTAQFVGKLDDAGTFSGTWTETATHKTLPFSLAKNTNGSAAIQYFHCREENCAKRAKPPIVAEPGYTLVNENLCPFIEVDIARATTGNALIDKKINLAIEQALYGSDRGYASVPAFVHSIHDLKEDGYIGHHFICGVNVNLHNILSLKWSQSIDYGGGHAGLFAQHVNLDLLTGNLLHLDNLLKPNYAAELRRRGEKAFLKEYGEGEPITFENGKFEMPEEFAIQADGLEFMYQNYNFGSFSGIMPSFIIPYSDLKDLVREDGALMRFY